MTFENFPSTSPTKFTPEKKSTNSKTALITALLLALLGTWGYIILDKSKTKEIIEHKETQYAAVLTEKDTLQNLLDEATIRYDDLKNIGVKKDSTIGVQSKEIIRRDREIAEKKLKIQNLLATANGDKSKLAEARQLILSLNNDLEGYKTQIEVLKGEKIKLTQEKDAVTQEKNNVQKVLDSTKSVVKDKENVIDVGSTLHASNFGVIGINEKRNGKEKETNTAKRVDKFRVSFDLDENRITASGTKEVYVCITMPDGKVFIEDGNGSFSTREGEIKSYTKKIGVNYSQGQRQSISFDWKAGDYTVGDYKIEVYNNGFKIGETIYHLKKGGLFS